MTHEIENNDQVILHKTGAWHGLGIVVEDAPTPKDALTMAGLDWGVQQKALYVLDQHGAQKLVETHVANYRSDIDELLGVVTANYCPVSNADMADFCEALVDNGQVKCETVGSIQNGKRVWFLLKGEEFSVANGDEMFPYILVSNGHDGKSSFRVTPTTVRAVCSNTLHAVIPRSDSGELGKSAIVLHHTASIMERVVEAKFALQHYTTAMEETKKLINVLSTKDMTQESVQQFFMESYAEDFNPIPTNPTNKKEERQRDRGMSAYQSFSRRFDDEKGIAGTSMWCALNAYTGLIQHDAKAYGKDDLARVEKRVNSNLFGLNADRTSKAFQRAIVMAG